MPYALFGSSRCCCGFSASSTPSREMTLHPVPTQGRLDSDHHLPSYFGIGSVAGGRARTERAPRIRRPNRVRRIRAPGRAVAQDPAADEAFLRQCRERAEEQRRIAKQQRRDGDADRM